MQAIRIALQPDLARCALWPRPAPKRDDASKLVCLELMPENGGGGSGPSAPVVCCQC